MTFIGVAWKGDAGEYQSFLDRHELGFLSHLRDDTGDIFSRFGVRYQPGWAFIDDDGSVEVQPGALGEEGLTRRVEELLAS